jgi:histidyl-tRNA synthetase
VSLTPPSLNTTMTDNIKKAAPPKKLAGVKGMNDILPPQSWAWTWLEQQVAELMSAYAYQNIRLPIVEPTALFVRGLGEVTDIVEKEMYCFEDRLNGEQLTLRPEGTAGVVRSAIEHNFLYEGGKRFYYIGPMFRHERPQRGRYRQFHQVGAEALGFQGPQVDAELILLAHHLWHKLGLQGVRLEINSLGQPDQRLAHRKALIAHFEGHIDQLDDDAKRRLHSNPLRILDSKNPAMREVVEQAPQLLDFVEGDALAHFNAVRAILDANGVAYRINPRLVRGMDYYNLTVFEFVTEHLGSQGTICGGGRYDGLIEQLGGKPAPAVGWALGIERVLELLQAQQAFNLAPQLDAYVIVESQALLPVATHTAQQLRHAGLRVQMHAAAGPDMGSFKSQFKRADASGAQWALVFAQQEFDQGQVSVKALRDGQGAQRTERLSELPAWSQRLQSRSSPAEAGPLADAPPSPHTD